jgi:hypothetical protein
MEKVKSNATTCLHHYIQELKDMLTSDGVFFCKACGKSIAIQQHSQITPHLHGCKNTVAATGLRNWPGRQFVINESCATHSYS